MPQFFHLENYAARRARRRRPSTARARTSWASEWDDAGGRRDRGLPARPRAAEGAAARSRSRATPSAGARCSASSGCLACHNLAPYAGRGAADQATSRCRSTARTSTGRPARRRDQARPRRGSTTGSRTPSAYWPETRMPNLRLSDQDAADITAYVMEDPDGAFHDVPQGWEPRTVGDARRPDARGAARAGALVLLRARAAPRSSRRLGGRGSRAPLERPAHAEGRGRREARRATTAASPATRSRAWRTMMPIGTELSNWGSKTVDKLDFGFAARRRAGRLDPGWITSTARAGSSRSCTRRAPTTASKVKNPHEKLRMPWFDFTDEQVHAIATFVRRPGQRRGPAREAWCPTPEQSSRWTPACAPCARRTASAAT